jgi:8-oxo-dGTP diphosphatase
MTRTEVVKALIRNKDDRFLMLEKSSRYDEMGDCWEQPGGKIEDGEDRFQAAEREIEAETGLQTENFQDLVRLEIESGEETVECYVVYTEEFSGEVRLSDEHQEYRWISRNEATELEWHRDASYIIPVIRYLERYLKKKDYGSGRGIEVVKTLIQDEEGRFLAVRKSHLEKISSGQKFKKYGEMSGKWELPGGRIGKKPGEDRFQAAEREILEELGIELGEGMDVVREEIEEENDVNVHILLYTQGEWKEEITLSDEHTEYRWVSPAEYLELDWHADAGYGYPPMKFIEEYMH